MLYPNGMKKTYNKIITHKNRGMSLEEDINESNTYYLSNDIGVIYKKPVPITITKVDYKSRQEAKIKEAYFKTPSTTDYNGLYKGKYIDFDAKECRSKTSFPLSNVHKHQIKHLQNILNHGGIAFLIVKFTLLNETYYLKAEDLISFIESNERKSIPIAFFKEKATLIPMKAFPRIDYLKIIDYLYF